MEGLIAYSWKEIYRFCFVFLCICGQFQSTSPPGACVWRGDLTEDFLRYKFGGLIFGVAYTWRGLFSDFTVFQGVNKRKQLSDTNKNGRVCLISQNETMI